MPHRQIGEIQISRILESENPDFDPAEFFPETPAEAWEPHLDWMKPHAMDPVSGNMIFPMQTYIVRTKHHVILMDTCVGDHKVRARESWNMTTSGKYLQDLAAQGLSPEDVDFVMCTHLHPDHVGWNTRLLDGRWVPTFPNAKYVMSRKELEYWTDFNVKHPIEYFADSVLPIVEANRTELVANDHAIDDEVWLESTAGHTPDHFAVRLSSQSANAVMSGDLMHSPVQCHHPEWPARPDYDREQARQTRRSFLERYCETDVLVCTAHFPAPSIGHIHRAGDAFRFEFEDHTW